MSQGSEDNASFVSRRGRQVGVHEVDLDGINIENDDAVRKPSVSKDAAVKPKAKQSPTKTPEQPPKQPFKPSSKRKLIILAVVAVLLLPILGAEFVGAQYKQGQASAKTELEQIVKEQVLPTQKQANVSAEKMRSFADSTSKIATNMCSKSFVSNVTDVYPRAREAHQNCVSHQQTYTDLASGLYELSDQAGYLERLGQAMQPISQPVGEGYAAIGDQQQLWKTASDKIKVITAPNSMRAVHSSLLKSSEDIRDSWNELAAANSSQDGPKFTVTEQKLGQQYEAFRQLSPQLQSVLSSSQLKIRQSYTAL